MLRRRYIMRMKIWVSKRSVVENWGWAVSTDEASSGELSADYNFGAVEVVISLLQLKKAWLKIWLIQFVAS